MFVFKMICLWVSDIVEDYWMYDGLVFSYFLGEFIKIFEGCEFFKE